MDPGWRSRRYAAALAAALAACSGGSSGPDASIADDGGLCVPAAERICDQERLIEVDSCGNPGEVLAECGDDKPCNEDLDACCSSAATSGRFSDGAAFSEVRFTSPAPASELELRASFRSFPAAGIAQHVSYRASIDGSSVVLAIRGDLNDSGNAGGPGIELSAYIGSEDTGSVEAVTPSYVDSGSTDGGYVRLNRPLSVGSRTVVSARLVRENGSGDADWFALYLGIDGEPEALAGRVLVPRAGTAPASIDDGAHVLSAGAVRSGEFLVTDVGKIQVYLGIPTYDGSAATAATLMYPPLAPDDLPFPNADVSPVPGDDGEARIRITQGGVTGRCTEAGELF